MKYPTAKPHVDYNCWCGSGPRDQVKAEASESGVTEGSPRPAQEQVSYCCDAPVYIVHEGGPVCTKCNKWATTKSSRPEIDNLYDAALWLLSSWCAFAESARYNDAIAAHLTADSRALLADEKARQGSFFSVQTPPDTQPTGTSASDGLSTADAVTVQYPPFTKAEIKHVPDSVVETAERD